MSLLKRLQKGELHAEGEFTIDMERASSKMSRFQFSDESEFLLHLVGGLFRLGMRELKVETSGSKLILKGDGCKLDSGIPDQLDEHLLNESSPLRRLSAACQAVLAHQPEEFLWLGKSPNQKYDFLSDESSQWKQPLLTEIQLSGLPAALVNLAVTRLREAARYCRRSLTINGIRVINCLPDVPFEAGGLPGGCRIDPDRAQSTLVLVVDEVATASKPVASDVPWMGVLYADQRLRLDASLASVIEDETYGQIDRDLPAARVKSVESLLLNRWREASLRPLLLELILSKDPLWSEMQEKLLRLTFFSDQRKLPWSFCSLEQANQPLYYYSSSLPPEQDLPAVILVESQPRAIAVLQKRLGSKIEEASAAVLRSLRRQLNREKWSQRPVEALELPPGRWLAQNSFWLRKSHHLVGLPDDWSQTGGSITLRHQGRFLAQRQLPDDELRFEGVSEVEESDIQELWDDVHNDAWKRFSQAYKEQAQELIKELANQPPEQLEALRRPLLRHLARSRKPEDSYFARTLLFPDHQGVPQSLASLLKAQANGQAIFLLDQSRMYHPDQLPDGLRPKGLWLLVGPEERDCLGRVRGLRLREMNVLFEDWHRARAELSHTATTTATVHWESPTCKAHLTLVPEGSECRVDVHSRGVYLGEYRIPAEEFCFHAHLYCDTLHLQVRLEPQNQGGKRWTVVTNHQAWTQCLQELRQQSLEAARLRCQRNLLDPEWSGWAERQILKGLAKTIPELARARLHPTRPNPSSLEELGRVERIFWTSLKVTREQVSAFLQEHPEACLWPALSSDRQNELERHYGLNWENVDRWFARKEKLLNFLARPVTQLKMPGALVEGPASAPLEGWLSVLVPAQPGQINWLHLQRTVLTQPAKSGLFARVSCSELELNEDCDQLLPRARREELEKEVQRQLLELLLSWLRQPRPGTTKYLVCWSDWEMIAAEVQQALETQPWFETSRGWKSWNELMAEPRCYEQSVKSADLPEDLFVVFTQELSRPMQDRLRARHSGWQDSKATEKLLRQRARKAEKEQGLQLRRLKMQNCQFKIEVEGGLVAWEPRQSQKILLVLEDRAVPIHNFPPGWMGFVESEHYSLQNSKDGERAELKSRSRRQLLLGLLPVVLERIAHGRLTPLERVQLANYALTALQSQNALHPEEEWKPLVQARWLPAADGTLCSLEQLHQEVVEGKTLLYWERKYALSNMGEELTLLMEDPVLLELVSRWTRKALVLRPKPVLYRDVRELAAPKLSNVRDVLEGFSSWVRRAPGRGLTQYVSRVMQRSQKALASRYQLYHEKAAQAEEAATQSRKQRQEELEKRSQGLLTDLRRQARGLLRGQARTEVMKVLDRARVVENRPKVLWAPASNGVLELSLTHPLVEACTHSEQPDPRHTLCLLLGLVSFINARLEPVTDEMEREFLKDLTVEVVGSYRDHIGA